MTEWWKNEVVYQIYPRSFCDSNHDGIGDIPGILSRLDYLKELGITSIWICPVYASPQADNGYDISDYKAIQPEYGTLEDMEQLLAEAKKRNIKIIMDLVINHTSDEHVWFKEAVRNPDSKYRNYYIFKEGRNGKPPTNWRSVFGGSVWEKVPGEENMYYYHAFAKKQPDLNWENKEMREEIYSMINWWLQKGIGGFRVDAINFIKKDQRWLDGTPDGADGLANCFQFSRNQKGIEKFFQELRHETFDKYNCMTVAEAVDVPYDQLGIFIGKNGCFSMMFDFKYCNIDMTPTEEWFPEQPWTLREYKEKMFASQTEINKTGWCGTFLENHDMQRVTCRLIRNPEERTPKAAKCLGATYMFLKGTPYIYEGQELGCLNNERKSIEEFDDISSKNQYHRALQEGYSEKEALSFVNRRSRDNTRSPMSWDDSLYAGFSDVQPWLACNEHSKQINAKNELQDPDSVFHFYQKLISLRQSHLPLITEGDILPIDSEDNVIAYKRVLGNEELVCICNLQAKETDISIDPDSSVLLSNDEVQKDHDVLHLSGYQTVLLEKK